MLHSFLTGILLEEEPAGVACDPVPPPPCWDMAALGEAGRAGRTRDHGDKPMSIMLWCELAMVAILAVQFRAQTSVGFGFDAILRGRQGRRQRRYKAWIG